MPLTRAAEEPRISPPWASGCPSIAVSQGRTLHSPDLRRPEVHREFPGSIYRYHPSIANCLVLIIRSAIFVPSEYKQDVAS